MQASNRLESTEAQSINGSNQRMIKKNCFSRKLKIILHLSRKPDNLLKYGSSVPAQAKMESSVSIVKL